VFAVVFVGMVLTFMVVIMMLVVVVVIIVIVMVIMVIVVMIVASCGSKSCDISNPNHVDISDLLITIEPSCELQPSALFNVSSINDVIVHFANQMWRVELR
jgi:hypothetical protein